MTLLLFLFFALVSGRRIVKQFEISHEFCLFYMLTVACTSLDCERNSGASSGSHSTRFLWGFAVFDGFWDGIGHSVISWEWNILSKDWFSGRWDTIASGKALKISLKFSSQGNSSKFPKSGKSREFIFSVVGQQRPSLYICPSWFALLYDAAPVPNQLKLATSLVTALE